MTRLISVKELRTRFPHILREMERGRRFILLHRSRPIGELRPVQKARDGEDLLGLLSNPPRRFLVRSRKSAVALTREERSRG